jgi:hypothetical protein
MQRFNLGTALVFLFILIVAIFAIRGVHQRIEGRYQAETATMVEYTLDDWLDVLGLYDLLGEPPVTPFPADQLPIAPTSTPEA